MVTVTKHCLMGKSYFVNGDLIATTGNLYARDISAGGKWHPSDSIIITPATGVFEITNDLGSIFDTYYVSGNVSASGIMAGGSEGKGIIRGFRDVYAFTLNDYERGLSSIRDMLSMAVLESRKQLFLQQQFSSVFSLMEHFLSCSFIRQTCDREDSYHEVLKSGLLQKKYGSKQVLNGPDCLEKELLFIELANKIVFHNQKAVKDLFTAAFGIDVDLTPLEGALNIRNDIIHRFGNTVTGSKVVITYEVINSLIATIDDLVHSTAKQITSLPKIE